jgi:hypothetical protein
VITQIIQKIKTLFLYFIKKLFELSFNKLAIILSFFLFSCCSYVNQSKAIKPEEIYCGITRGQFLMNDKNYITTKNKNYKDKLAKINSNFINKGFNLIVISGQKPTGGFSLKLKNINKKKDIIYLSFIDKEPPKNSTVTMATTYPYCVLKIKNLDKFKISIKQL